MHMKKKFNFGRALTFQTIPPLREKTCDLTWQDWLPTAPPTTEETKMDTSILGREEHVPALDLDEGTHMVNQCSFASFTVICWGSHCLNLRFLFPRVVESPLIDFVA